MTHKPIEYTVTVTRAGQVSLCHYDRTLERWVTDREDAKEPTTMTAPTYRIETLDRHGNWDADLGPGDNAFETEADAWAMVAELRTIDEDWATAEYRVTALDDRS